MEPVSVRVGADEEYVPLDEELYLTVKEDTSSNLNVLAQLCAEPEYVKYLSSTSGFNVPFLVTML